MSVGANILAGLKLENVLSAVDSMISKNFDWESPFGERGVARLIISKLLPEKVFHKISNVSVVGQGYMGFPMSLLIADAGHKVTGVDLSKQRVNDLNLGITPFEEKGLDELHRRIKQKNPPFFTTDQISSEIYLVSVPTNQKDERCDLSHVLSATRAIARKCEENALVIIESTITPGTCQLIKNTIFTDKNVYIAHAPERAIPGNTLKELYLNERIIGGLCETATRLACNFYGSL